jgi:hypothetical protein
VTTQLRLRTGFEIELLAPRGSSRRTLAVALADRCRGRVRPRWHHDSEPSLVPGLGHFLHLSNGFDVIDAAGEPVCSLVDDITIVADLDGHAVPAPGWYRVLTDDPRLLRLLAEQLDPAAPLPSVLEPVAALWGVPVQRHGDVVQLNDASGATVALAAPVGGERERPCEIVTPPLAADHAVALDRLLTVARELGFTVPVEAAVHVHLDGAPFRSASALANVVRLFGWWRPALHELLETNPACRRLAPLPRPLVDAVAGTPTYEQLAAAAKAGGLSKFFDVNLTQLFATRPIRDTLEVRIMPGSLDTAAILRRAGLVEHLLRRCLDPTPFPRPISGTISELLHAAPADDSAAVESVAQR